MVGNWYFTSVIGNSLSKILPCIVASRRSHLPALLLASKSYDVENATERKKCDKRMAVYDFHELKLLLRPVTRLILFLLKSGGVHFRCEKDTFITQL